MSRWFLSHLPQRISDYYDRFEHHLLVKVADAGIAVASAYFKSVFPSVKGDYFECAPTVANKAFLRGDAVEYILALDIALRRNEVDWFEQLTTVQDFV